MAAAVPAIATTFGASAGTAATLGTIANVVGIGLSLASAVAGSQAQEIDNSAAIAAAQTNREIANRNAALSEFQTEADKEKQDRERRLRLGANIAAGGVSGLGQNFDILRDNAAQEELDILRIEQQGQLEANSFRQTASLEEQKINSLQQQRRVGRGTSILSGASGILNTVSGLS